MEIKTDMNHRERDEFARISAELSDCLNKMSEALRKEDDWTVLANLIAINIAGPTLVKRLAEIFEEWKTHQDLQETEEIVEKLMNDAGF